MDMAIDTGLTNDNSTSSMATPTLYWVAAISLCALDTANLSIKMRMELIHLLAPDTPTAETQTKAWIEENCKGYQMVEAKLMPISPEMMQASLLSQGLIQAVPPVENAPLVSAEMPVTEEITEG
jgi:hypothetical protein